MNLYITADRIGGFGGGATVTYHESQALKSIGDCQVIGRDQMANAKGEDPWLWDDHLYAILDGPRLAHFYAGTFARTVNNLKVLGSKVSYTAAAHDIDLSRREHERLGLFYNYPHITNPDLWKRYIGGYLAADLVICPSYHSKMVMERFGCKSVCVIPHGTVLPEKVAPLPNKFAVGYLGAIGPDKGLIYLLQAWKKLDYKDAILVIGGAHSNSEFMLKMVQEFGGGQICLLGWVNNVADFYNSISLYCQPSVTEGFGIEVLEAMSYGRPVICSEGAGASDLISNETPLLTFRSADVDSLAGMINWAQSKPYLMDGIGAQNREKAKSYSWDRIRSRYVETWKSLLGEKA